jgi:hypothetical protein
MLKIFLLTWIFTHLPIIQNTIDTYYLRWSTNWKKPWVTITNAIYSVLGCHKCLTFWSVLILTQNLFAALLGALMAYIIMLLEDMSRK